MSAPFDETARTIEPQDGRAPAPAQGSLRVLVVEDEALIRMLFEEMLADLGHAIEAAAADLDAAVELARTSDCDLAILDVHLNGAAVYPAAEILAVRGIPFIFATGYSGAELPEAFRGRPTMEKPFEPERLQVLIAQAVGQ